MRCGMMDLVSPRRVDKSNQKTVTVALETVG